MLCLLLNRLSLRFIGYGKVRWVLVRSGAVRYGMVRYGTVRSGQVWWHVT